MIFESSYKVWEACDPDPQSTRPHLQHVMVKRVGDQPTISGQYRGLMAASDSFILAVVPCLLDQDDVPGMVRASAIKLAGTKYPRGLEPRVDLTGTETVSVITRDGSVTLSRTDGLAVDYAYPDYSVVIPTRHAPLVSVKFQAALLARLSKALGAPFVSFQFGRDAQSPVIVRPHTSSVNGSVEPPYGVLMPTWRAGERTA